MAKRRGPYKKYLYDNHAPIPKRSRTYYDEEQVNLVHKHNPSVLAALHL